MFPRGGTTIGCQPGPNARRARFVRMWFCILRILPRRKAGWARICQEGGNFLQPSETSAEKRGWEPLSIFCSVWFLGISLKLLDECRPADCRVLFITQPRRHWETEKSLQKRFWNVWVHLACQINPTMTALRYAWLCSVLRVLKHTV